MTGVHLYLPTIVPQWEIFLGIVLILMGYIEKKIVLTRLGWIVLIVTGLTAMFFNLFGELSTIAKLHEPNAIESLLVKTLWQAVAGGVLAFVSLLLFHFKSRRYPLLSILTLVYFVLIFFLFYQVSQSSGKLIQNQPPTEQQK